MKGRVVPHRRQLPAPALALAGVLSGLVGCAQVTGTDEYSVVGASKIEAENPNRELPPFLTGAECEACANQFCEQELEHCGASEACSSWLSNTREHPDPLTAYQRHRTEMEIKWRADRGGERDDAILRLRDCAQNCLEACQVGQNFSCVGKFDWNFAAPWNLRTRITDPVGNGRPLSRVSACRDVDQCDPPLSSTDTNKDGFAPLELDGRFPIDYLQLEVPDHLPWRWMQSRPLAENDYVSAGLFTDALVYEWYKAFDYQFVNDQSLLIVQPWDCSGIHAKQITVEVWLPSADGLKFCDQCVYAYARGPSDTPDRLLKALSTEGRAAYIGQVPPLRVHVIWRRVDAPQDVVSFVPVNVRGGQIIFVKAFPASREELESFPDPRR
jgi:hypothetical protein